MDHELSSRPRAITIENGQMYEGFQKKQEQAREKLKKKFKRKGWEFEHKIIKIDSDGTYDGGLPQPVIWITQAALAIGKDEQLFLGWIKGDDATANLCRIKQIWELLIELNDKGKATLHLPLQFAKKHEIIGWCKENKIYSNCWWCENPTEQGRKCGQCDCCLAMVAAEAILAQKAKKKPDVIKELADKLKSME